MATFETLRQFYSAIDDLIRDLRAEGCSAEADRLNTLLNEQAWTTGSELCGELMLALRQMKGAYSPKLKKDIRACRDFAARHC